MKRVATLTLILFAIVATTAYAGLWGSIKGAALGQIAQATVGGIFFLLSIFLGAKVLRFKQVAQEAIDVVFAIRDATAADSPGGKSITKAEIDGIISEVSELGIAGLAAFGKSQPSTP